MSRALSQATLDAIGVACAQAVAAAFAAMSAPAAAPASAASSSAATPYVADPLASGKLCRCGHAHKRPVVLAERPRLARESACSIKGCVSHPACK